jgi:hypothetical protein
MKRTFGSKDRQQHEGGESGTNRTYMKADTFFPAGTGNIFLHG